MIPDSKSIDPDLIKMFEDVPNKAAHQTIVQTIVHTPKNHVDSSRSVWSDNATTMMAFEYGYVLGSMSDGATKPDIKSFLSDLLKGLRECITNEIGKIENNAEKMHDIYQAIQHMINLLSEKYKNIETSSSNKINVEAITASMHGFITSYIVSNYKPEIKK